MERLDGLPGGDLVAEGLRDLAGSADTIASLLVAVGAPRLRRAGIPVPPTVPDPEHRLYRLLTATCGDAAHARYNALMRRLVSCERAIESGR